MSQAPETICLRPRFKGIENFLKRIAFNLGNTPSQTEVKIISCIPIDVTDLQNKIVELEKELDEREGHSAAPPDHAAAVHTALGVPTFTPRLAPHPPTPTSTSGSDPASPDLPPPDATHPHRPTNDGKLDNRKTDKPQHKPKNMDKKKSRGKTQYVYFAQTQCCSPFASTERDGGGRDKRRASEEAAEKQSYLADVVQRQYRPERVQEEPSSSHFSWPVCRDEPPVAPLPPLNCDMCSSCHGPFHDLDARPPPPAAPQPPARRDYNMYYDSSLYDIVPVRDRPTNIMYGDGFYCDGGKKVIVDRGRIRERARPRQYIVNYATVPALRSGPKLRYKRKLATKSYVKRDQVVRAMQQRRKLDRWSSAETLHNSCVECGEVYTKPAHPKSREPSLPTPRPSLPPPTPPPPTPPPPPPVLLKNAECLTMSFNDTECQTATSRSVQLEPVPPEQNKTEITLNQIKSILHAVLTEVKTNSQMKTLAEDKETKDAIVQKGPSQSNIATGLNNLNTYTYSPQNMKPFEMSVSGQMFGSQPCYPQGPGAAGAGGPESSRAHVTFGAGLTPYAHAKCLQNYPLFIHTPGRQCACCYRSIPQPVSALHHTPPAHTATNTEAGPAVRDQRSKETDKLIKEIYKSLAVNMSSPQKQSSSSDYADLKSSANNSQKKFEFKFETKPKSKFATPEIATKRQVPPTTVFMSKGFDINLQSNTASLRSKLLTSTATETTTATATATSSGVTASSETARGDHVRDLLPARGELPSTESERDPPPAARYTRARRRPAATASASEDEDTETRSTDSDSEATVVAEEPEKKEKTGLFSKMKKLFSSRPRRRRKKDDDYEKEQDQSSDSDSYETVYSGRSNRHEKRSEQRRRDSPRAHHASPSPPPPPVRRAPAPRSPPAHRASPSPRHRPHSKVSYSRYHMPRRDSAGRARRSPYMEQEYRRYWNENLTFHEGDTPRYSSEQPHSGESVRRRSPYHRTYEARAALISHPGRPGSLYQPPPHHQPAQEQVSKCGQTSAAPLVPTGVKHAPKGLAWLKKYNPGFHCGAQWKSLILDG